MVKVYIPNNNVEERRYILTILLDEFLGLEFDIEINEKYTDWIIVLENKKKLVFKDGFFSHFKKELSYLKYESIPNKITFGKNQFMPENDIPILYGNDVCKVDKTKSIICEIDIFASAFFMLTRWEEFVNKKRDSHNRFVAKYSVAFKFNFLHRAIVNEYTEMLWEMLLHLGCKQERKEREYELMVTHDVDFIKKYTSLLSGVREILGDIIKRKNLRKALFNFKEKILVLFNFKKDPFDTFDWLMDASERAKIKSYFFFMGKGETKFDNFYKLSDNFVTSIIKKIKKRGHYIGMHPTYNSYNNFKQFEKEKKELEKFIETSISIGRQHYLRFSVPYTWQIWEDNNMEWDSTLGYPDKEGFRGGTCYNYSTFNILTRKKLKLKVMPLIVMEGSFFTYQKEVKSKDVIKKILDLKKTVKKYNGTFVLLWHNSSFTKDLLEYKKLYKKIIYE